jgi:hypothetical protein
MAYLVTSDHSELVPVKRLRGAAAALSEVKVLLGQKSCNCICHQIAEIVRAKARICPRKHFCDFAAFGDHTDPRKYRLPHLVVLIHAGTNS